MLNSCQHPSFDIEKHSRVWCLMVFNLLCILFIFHKFHMGGFRRIWMDLACVSCGYCVQNLPVSAGREKRASLPPNVSLQKAMQAPWLSYLPVDMMNFHWKWVTLMVHTVCIPMRHIINFYITELARHEDMYIF